MNDYDEVLSQIVKKIENTNFRVGKKIPYLTDLNGRYTTDMIDENLAWWTNGFYAGIMWEVFLVENNEYLKNTAVFIENEFDKLLNEPNKLDHDIGFMWLHIAIANYRITNNLISKTRGLHAANLLAARFNANGNYLVAWNNADNHMIIDSLMNIPLLFWATEETGDQRFKSIAIKHLETALTYIQRPDGSCNHICIFNSETGEYIESIGGQGFGPGSSWARGQAWGIYGFSLAYKYTADERYLIAAQKVTNYFISNIVQYSFVTPIDFRAPSENLLLDTTASAIAASGLLELARYVNEAESLNLHYVSKLILDKLVNEFCDFNLGTDGILDKGSAKYHNDKIEPEQKIIYGDYFLIEAILKHLDYEINMW